MASPTDMPSLEDDALNTRSTTMVAFVGFTVLVWDHLITFVDEVELVWRGKKGLLVYLFLLYRPLLRRQSSFHASQLGDRRAMTNIGTQVAGLMMFLRVRAIYNKKKEVVGSVMVLFLAWVGVTAWLLTHGQAVTHAPNVHSCSMIFDTSL
ncbi:hypothetical protein BU15DRAFT_69658 [Melanogaster broomeanus]|nr:hypothetical protein BU15DRAFT_69658 [Melanogaster broomeanus]